MDESPTFFPQAARTLKPTITAQALFIRTGAPFVLSYSQSPWRSGYWVLKPRMAR